MSLLSSHSPSAGVESNDSDSQGYVRLRGYPDCGVRTTRAALMLMLACSNLGLVFPVLYIFNQKNIYFILTMICCGIANLLLIVVLFRVVSYYLFLRRRKASGIPFDPNTTLSFANYILKLAFLPLEDYSGN
ncbi:hypothetical protein TNIN_463351 [Trichonephila inaurata madagascariensis]|uniref:Uncharacterized protein n=1 Tax=Trichonephila inaurata madagascariensis TaxID=2747483 RepID=A0A8X6Y5U4_9ARAC|nr:hypothetical protein TNIN_463351 [Trichonephila inaurata madagascariensis]